jgi:hypothetical protein
MGSRLARWKIKLQEYDYDIKYKPGRVNANADALSRNPVDFKEVRSSKADANGGDCHDDAITNLGSNIGCSTEGKVLYHEYPIERVLVTTCETDDRDMDDTESFGNIYREMTNSKVTEIDINGETDEKEKASVNLMGNDAPMTIDSGEVVSSIPKPNSSRGGSRQGGEETEPSMLASEGCELVRRVIPVPDSLKGHEGVPGAGCDGAIAQTSPPRPGYTCALEARDSSFDGVECTYDREASVEREGGWDTIVGICPSFPDDEGGWGTIVGTCPSSPKGEGGWGTIVGICPSTLEGVSSAPAGQVEMLSESTELATRKCLVNPRRAGHAEMLSESAELLRNHRDDLIDDNDVLSEVETKKLTGIWGETLIHKNETDDEFDVPRKRFKTNESASIEAIQVFHAGSRQGNRIPTPLFQLSRDRVWMRDDHILNFVSCDGVLTTSLGRELLENSIIKLSDLKDPQAVIGYVTSKPYGGRRVYNLYVKEKFDSKIFARNIETAVITLKEALELTKTKTFSLSQQGNGFDKLPWSIIERIFRTHFGHRGYEITVCTGEVQIPEVEKRPEIIKECHDSTVGGHRGESTTLNRIRERFYWRGMREEVRNYVKACESCQKRKLTRVKTKMPMRITDTPIRTFEKFKLTW